MRVQRISATSVACAIAAVLCLVALGDMRYGFYLFLRWVVCGASLAAACTLVGRRAFRAALPGWGFAILFNPVLRIPLDREVWQVLNLLAFGGLAIYSIMCRTK